MNPEIERWRQYLRRDPTRFLLEEEGDPSVALWYLIDVAHRPEDSVAVIEQRDRVLYSTPVQELFSAQKPEGYWEEPDSLVDPRYRATLWNLALLAELGVPRDSRRGRAASEFTLENFLGKDGRFRGLDAIESGYLIHALAYFNLAADARVSHAADSLLAKVARERVSDETLVTALWATRGMTGREAERVELQERLIASLANRAEFGPITFPPFDPSDPLFILRVLSDTPSIRDPRLTTLVSWMVGKQNESAQWPLEKSLSGELTTRVEEEGPSSLWATLNAVRVITTLVIGNW